jgi:hypothetical protein
VTCGESAVTEDAAGGPPDVGARADAEAVRRRAAQDRRRRRVFGDVLDDTTTDDRPEPTTSTEGDRWLRDNVPPHHGA